MKKLLTALLASAVAGALFVAAPLVAAPPSSNTYNSSDTTTFACGDSNNTVAIKAPEHLWPPNHKPYNDIAVTATDPDGGPITLTTDGTHNQYEGDVEAKGSGNTTDDIASRDEHAIDGPNHTETHPVAVEEGSGSVTTDWMARAERAGTIRDGRVYTLHAIAEFADSEPCEGTVTFKVPHDMRKSERFPEE